MTVFYDRLKALCVERGTTLTAFARKRLGVQSSTSSRWNGRTSPSSDIVRKAALAMNVSADYLLGLIDRPEPIGSPRADSPTPASLDEDAVLDAYRHADAATRAVALATMRAVLETMLKQKNAKNEGGGKNLHIPDAKGL